MSDITDNRFYREKGADAPTGDQLRAPFKAGWEMSETAHVEDGWEESYSYWSVIKSKALVEGSIPFNYTQLSVARNTGTAAPRSERAGFL